MEGAGLPRSRVEDADTGHLGQVPTTRQEVWEHGRHGVQSPWPSWGKAVSGPTDEGSQGEGCVSAFLQRGGTHVQMFLWGLALHRCEMVGASERPGARLTWLLVAQCALSGRTMGPARSLSLLCHLPAPMSPVAWGSRCGTRR